VAGEDDDHGEGQLGLHGLEQAETVQLRHHQIGDDDGRIRVCGLRERFLPVGGFLDLVTPGRDQRRQALARGLQIVRDEYPMRHGRHYVTPSRARCA
jgi:hypothetical protein